MNSGQLAASSQAPARLANFTTLRLGGPARELRVCDTEESLLSAVRAADSAGEQVLILGGGSNLVVSDAGFPGVVLRVMTRGIERHQVGEQVLLTVQAGEPWDDVVRLAVGDGLAGIEALSGIPGSTGATPIQNVGAYGQQVCERIVTVRVFDRARDVVEELEPHACQFSYRQSRFKNLPDRYVVLAVTFALPSRSYSMPIQYSELANALGVSVGDPGPLPAVREAVLRLRRGKGMVLDPGDPDTVSAGSFFLNPVLEADEWEGLVRRASERLGQGVHVPSFPKGNRIKTSAAWLIERAGFSRGYGTPHGIAISCKHTLALTNRGRGTTAELMALAQEIALGVHEAFGVWLVPEPVFVGHEWSVPSGGHRGQ